MFICPADDISSKVGEARIMSLQDLSLALRSHRPGDVVEVVWRRGGATLSARVTLGERKRD